MSTKKSFIKPQWREEFRQQGRIIFGKNRYWFHILFWLLSAGALVLQVSELLSNQGKNWKIKVEINGAIKNYNVYDIWNYVYGVLIGALLVYVFLLLIIPFARYKNKKRYLYLGFLLLTTLWLLTVFLAGFYAGYTGTGTKEESGMHIGMSIGVTATISFIIAFSFFSFYYFLDLYDQQKNLNKFEEIFTQKTIAETNFLKTQINPHFLFNTLNNMYALSLQQSDKATAITRQLRSLCAYMLEDCKEEMVSMEGEINFIRSYISLEQLRNKDENVHIELVVNGDLHNKQIAPLLLINFVENAFKHGVKAGLEKASVFVRFQVTDKILTFEINNSKPTANIEHEGKSISDDGGIGINNVKRRLELLYPGKHKLRITDSPTQFSVHLNIQLD